MSRYPFAEWVAEQFRFTAFTLPGSADPAVDQWWRDVVGSDPDESAANLRIGLRTLAIGFRSGKLVLKLEPGRVDWLFVPRDPDPTAGPLAELPSVGPITENLESFSDLVERWLLREDVPDIVRTAFGAAVRHSEPDRRSAYVRLPDYLPIRLNPDSSDFNLQISVPTDSRAHIDGLRINRLTRWAVVGLARVELRLDSTRVAASSQFVDYAIRLELDINTSPEFQRPLPRERLVELYRELVALGCNVVVDGLPQ